MAPTLAEDMIAAGVEPIACYCIGPSQDDLTSVGSLEEGEVPAEVDGAGPE